MLPIIKLWTDFKAIVVASSPALTVHYSEDRNKYKLLAKDNGNEYRSEILKNVDFLDSPPTHDWAADKVEFEGTYKALAKPSVYIN